jgi:penicillin-binding protein 1A
MLRGGPAHGTGVRAQIGRPLAGKTGTAQNYTSAFFDGFTPQLATAVWVGYAGRPKPMTNLFHGGPVLGGTYPALIFADFMKSAMAGKPVKGFPAPPAPPSVAMPDVLGKSREEAEAILKGNGFTVRVSGSGKVVTASDPPAGARVAKGSVVGITMGEKPPDVGKPVVFKPGQQATVPRVVGMSFPQAVAVLAAAGLRADPKLTKVGGPGRIGRVIQQSPPPGTRLAPGSAVTIWVVGR